MRREIFLVCSEKQLSYAARNGSHMRREQLSYAVRNSSRMQQEVALICGEKSSHMRREQFSYAARNSSRMQQEIALICGENSSHMRREQLSYAAMQLEITLVCSQKYLSYEAGNSSPMQLEIALICSQKYLSHAGRIALTCRTNSSHMQDEQLSHCMIRNKSSYLPENSYMIYSSFVTKNM